MTIQEKIDIVEDKIENLSEACDDDVDLKQVLSDLCLIVREIDRCLTVTANDLSQHLNS